MLAFLEAENKRLWARSVDSLRTQQMGNPVGQRRAVERFKRTVGPLALDVRLKPGKRGHCELTVSAWTIWDAAKAALVDPLREELDVYDSMVGGAPHMCNLYSETKGQAAIRALFRTVHDRTGNLPAFPGIFPNQPAPIVRTSVDGERELVMARWGMPGPPQFGGQPVTNIRNVASPHWRGWLSVRTRCLVPATSFCEYAPTTPRKTPTWFAISEDRPCSPSPASGRGGAACAG